MFGEYSPKRKPLQISRTLVVDEGGRLQCSKGMTSTSTGVVFNTAPVEVLADKGLQYSNGMASPQKTPSPEFNPLRMPV